MSVAKKQFTVSSSNVFFFVVDLYFYPDEKLMKMTHDSCETEVG